MGWTGVLDGTTHLVKRLQVFSFQRLFNATSGPFYVCILAEKNHVSPLKVPSSIILHAPTPKTISTIQALIAKSISQRHWDKRLGTSAVHSYKGVHTRPGIRMRWWSFKKQSICDNNNVTGIQQSRDPRSTCWSTFHSSLHFFAV